MCRITLCTVVALVAMLGLNGCKREKPDDVTAIVQGVVMFQEHPGIPIKPKPAAAPRSGIVIRVVSIKTEKVVGEATSDARGEFVIEVPPGCYRIDVVKTDRHDQLRIWPDEVELEDGDIVEIKVQLDHWNP